MATDIKNDATLSTNLVSCWEMQEESGTRVDSHGSNDLTDTNSVGYGAGKVLANAADFERTSDEYMSVADASQTGLDPTTDFSVSVWLKFETLPSAYGGLQNMYLVAKEPSPGYRIQWYSASDLALVSYWNTAGNIYQADTDSTSITSGADVGSWHHWAFTIDTSAKTIKVYRDNTEQSMSTLSDSGAVSIGNNANPFYVGAAWAPSNTEIDGLMEQLCFWDKVLTSTEVSDLYNSGSGIPYEAAGGGANSNFLMFM